MDLNEIEEQYKRELDASEAKFIEDIKNGIDVKQVEVEYKQSTEKARKNYDEKLFRFLKENKYKDIVKPKEVKQEKQKVFHVDSSDYRPSFFEKLNQKRQLLFFKLFFHLKNSFKKEVPSYLLYIYFRLKIKAIRLFDEIKAPIIFIKNDILDMFGSIKTKFKELTHTK